jgi:hypothetical protein
MGLRLVAPAVLTAAILAATPAASAQTWQKYANTDFNFRVETPGAPAISNASTATAAGAVPTFSATVELGDRGLLTVSVGDYGALLAGHSIDVDKALEGSVQGEVANIDGTLDSETTISVDGAPGREVIAHTVDAVVRSRMIFRDNRIYILMGIGPKAAGAPSEFERFEASFHFTNRTAAARGGKRRPRGGSSGG